MEHEFRALAEHLQLHELDVEEIRLSGRGIGGTIPRAIVNYARLRRLLLDDNNISGMIPEEIYHLERIEKLRLDENGELSGNISLNIGNLQQLCKLYLCECDLSDFIPISIGNLRRLRILNLSGNDLTGPIPKEIAYLTNLTELFLDCNRLSKKIPGGVTALTNLVQLDLSNNLLTGHIPPGVGLLTNLVSLRLHGNTLGGSLPEEMGYLTNLTWLTLHSNQFIGEIPQLICVLPCTHVDISANYFTDSELIPANWVQNDAFQIPVNPEENDLPNLMGARMMFVNGMGAPVQQGFFGFGEGEAIPLLQNALQAEPGRREPAIEQEMVEIPDDRGVEMLVDRARAMARMAGRRDHNLR